MLSIVPGEPISTIWHELSVPQKIRIRDQCRKAISILCQKDIYNLGYRETQCALLKGN